MVSRVQEYVVNNGSEYTTVEWQGKRVDVEMIEVLHFNEEFQMSPNIPEAIDNFSPKLPWANIHFDERTSGVPMNPPPSHRLWSKQTEIYFEGGEKFSHSYPERLWSKGLHSGIRYEIADLNTLVEVIRRDPGTRQAYLPMFFPEDLSASLAGDRVPCSLGWQFIIRDGKMDCFYPIRSCDIFRHLRNDLYLANRLVLWIIEQTGLPVVPGKLVFHATSLHCFKDDVELYRKGLIK